MTKQIAYWDDDNENPPLRLPDVPGLIVAATEQPEQSIFNAALHLDCDYHNDWSDKFRDESMDSAYSKWITTNFLGNTIGVGQRSTMDYVNRIIIVGPNPMDVFGSAMADYSDITSAIECTEQEGRCEALLAATVMAITRMVANNN